MNQLIQQAEYSQSAQIELTLAFKESQLPPTRDTVEKALRHAMAATTKLNALDCLLRLGELPRRGE